MKVKDVIKKARTGLSDTKTKRTVLRFILNFVMTVFFSVCGSLLAMFAFGFWLRPILDRAPIDQSLILCLTGYIFYLFFTSVIAWRSGVRITKKEKPSVREFFRTDLAATLVYALPAVVLYIMYNKSDASWVNGLVAYMPFLFLRDLLRFEELSVLVTMVASTGLRTGLFALGKKLWLHRGGYDQFD